MHVAARSGIFFVPCGNIQWISCLKYDENISNQLRSELAKHIYKSQSHYVEIIIRRRIQHLSFIDRGVARALTLGGGASAFKGCRATSPPGKFKILGF
jgi:hypothetical protein